MTTTDYKEKYEAALERCKKLYNEAKANEYTSDIEDYETIFPELKESGDERMIQYFKDLAPFDKADELYEKYGFSHKDAIAWLEKQGEHSNFLSKIQVGDKVTRNEDGVLVNLSQLKRVAKKQGEQKPIVNDNAKEMFIKALERVEEQNAKGYKLTDCDKNSWWEDFKNYTSCTIEQKPTGWSEKLIADVFEMVGLAKIVREQENDALTRALQSAMIELAKYSVVPQIRQEWSEEDKQAIEDAETWLDTLCDYLKNNSSECIPTVKEVISKLKSLKDRVQPQSHWKPSNKHYELEEFAKIVRSNLTGISKAVQELFEAKYLQLTGNKMYRGFKD